MNTLKISIIGMFLILLVSNENHAQTLDLKEVESEIREAALKEQNAFKSGDCKTVLELMETEITFLANGRKVTSIDMIGKFCNSIPRPFKQPIIDELEIFPLSAQTGYVVRTLEYPKDDNTMIKEYVTKIWRKTNGEWKISHLHSTVKEVTSN